MKLSLIKSLIIITFHKVSLLINTALAMHQYPFLSNAVLPDATPANSIGHHIFTFAVLLPILPHALVLSFVSPSVNTESVFFILRVGPFVPATI